MKRHMYQGPGASCPHPGLSPPAGQAETGHSPVVREVVSPHTTFLMALGWSLGASDRNAQKHVGGGSHCLSDPRPQCVALSLWGPGQPGLQPAGDQSSRPGPWGEGPTAGHPPGAAGTPVPPSRRQKATRGSWGGRGAPHAPEDTTAPTAGKPRGGGGAQLLVQKHRPPGAGRREQGQGCGAGGGRRTDGAEQALTGAPGAWVRPGP